MNNLYDKDHNINVVIAFDSICLFHLVVKTIYDIYNEEGEE